MYVGVVGVNLFKGTQRCAEFNRLCRFDSCSVPQSSFIACFLIGFLVTCTGALVVPVLNLNFKRLWHTPVHAAISTAPVMVTGMILTWVTPINAPKITMAAPGTMMASMMMRMKIGGTPVTTRICNINDYGYFLRLAAGGSLERSTNYSEDELIFELEIKQRHIENAVSTNKNKIISYNEAKKDT